MEQQSPQGVLVCGHTVLVINEYSQPALRIHLVGADLHVIEELTDSGVGDQVQCRIWGLGKV